MSETTPYKRRVQIGSATLYLGDCRDILPTLDPVEAIIVDPPYSERCHQGHDAGAGLARDGSERAELGYSCLSLADVDELAAAYAKACSGWIVWMTDSDLALAVRKSLEQEDRYAFAPLPFYAPGSRVRLTGDGPSSWTDWIVVARTKRQSKWGTLPGGYMAGPGWNDKARMGGKPSLLMAALVRDYSRAGDTVLDTHMGAGTTGVACAKLGRRFIGIEIDEEAFDLSCRRIEMAQAQGDMFVAPAAIEKPVDLFA